MAKRNAQKESARARAAALKAQQEAKERRQRLILVGVTLGIIAVIVAGLVIAALNKDEGSSTASSKSTAAPMAESVQKSLTSVGAKELDDIGVGTVTNFPKKVKDGQAVTSNGKPQVLYVGAEYCPFCAGLRWSTAVAMSRFGTWSPLKTSHSAADDVHPNTATLSFSQAAGTKLTSDHVDFVSYETATNIRRNGVYTKLDEIHDDHLKTFQKLDAPPYVDEQSKGAIPFISFGGKVIQAGGIYDTTLLQGKTAEQIVEALKNPTDPITVAVLGGANAITAATCEATGGKPTDVCTAPGVKAAAEKLGTAG